MNESIKFKSKQWSQMTKTWKLHTDGVKTNSKRILILNLFRSMRKISLPCNPRIVSINPTIQWMKQLLKKMSRIVGTLLIFSAAFNCNRSDNLFIILAFNVIFVTCVTEIFRVIFIFYYFEGTYDINASTIFIFLIFHLKKIKQIIPKITNVYFFTIYKPLKQPLDS